MTSSSFTNSDRPTYTRRAFLSRCSGFAAIALAPAALSRAATKDTNPAVIIRALRPLCVRGINYYPAQTPWGGFWTKTPPEVVERDMELAASLNINAVRTFVQCSAATRDAKLNDADGHVAGAYLDKFEHFLSVAWERGIRTVACFDFDAETLTGDGVWRRVLEAFVSRYRQDGRVLMWDLMNEPEGRHWDEPTRAYLKSAVPHIKELDGEHFSTVGIGWEIDRLAELGLPDVLQYHEYAPKKELFDAGTQRVGKTIARLRHTGGDRPIIIGEFGMSTARDPQHGAGASWQSRLPDAPGTEEDQARLYRIILDAAREFRIAGVMPWCLHSYPTQEKGFLTPAESMFGLIRPDGSLKPAAELLKDRYRQWEEGSR